MLESLVSKWVTATSSISLITYAKSYALGRENSATPNSQWEDLNKLPDLNSVHWDNIKTQLDLVLLALETLTGIGSEAMLSAATDRI